MTSGEPAGRVTLLPKRARPFYARHPWVFAGAIARVDGDPPDGAVVDVLSHSGAFIARGLYNGRSKIRTRLYSWAPDVPLDRDFFRTRLDAALRLRRDVLGLAGPGRAYRLAFSEADFLSGCSIDVYDRWPVVQFTSLAMAARREMFAGLLRDLVNPDGIYVRTERDIGRLEGLELQDGPLWGNIPAGPIVIEEAGLKFLVNLSVGQKTGFYLDQRDNRQAVARLCKGRRVLDAFCYTGGFGLHAARAGAREVVSVDVSEPALALARENAAANGLKTIRFESGDVFERLAEQAAAGERYGVVILDPPKFARTRQTVDEALRGYRRLQTLGVRLLEPDGVLVTCCCSGAISADMLETLLAQLAAEERRDIQVIERRGQAADHPVSATCLESNYLKCLVGRVV